MTLFISDINVRNKTDQICRGLETIEGACVELARVLESVTMRGGGLDSSNMRDAMQLRLQEAEAMASAIHSLRNGIMVDSGDYLRDIEGIDTYLY